MRKISVIGLNATAAMPQMLRERAASVREIDKRLGREVPACYASDFPVIGGWGYTQEDACVFDFGDKFSEYPPKTRRSIMESESIYLQRLFFERRVYEEIIYHPLSGTPDLHCLKWKKTRQALVHGNNNRTYDRVNFQVYGFLKDDLDFLKADYIKCMKNNDFAGMEKNQKMADERIVIYDSVCWFDISCYWNIE